MGRRRTRLIRLALGLVGGAALVVAPPIARPVAAAAGDAWEVWLDAPLPHDLPAGSPVHLGFIMWNPDEGSTITFFGSEVRAHPASGGKVIKAAADTDWPGHSFVDFVVPPGGLGRIDFGVYRNAGIAGAGTTITLDFQRVRVAGVGAPPGISLRLIGTVRPAPAGPVIVGEPVDVDLKFAPRLPWPSGSIELPDALTLRVREPGAEGAKDLAAPLVERSVARYRASLEVDRPGAYILEAATRPDAPAEERFTESEIRIVAETAAEAGESAAPPAPGQVTTTGTTGASSGSIVPPSGLADQGLPLGVLAPAAVAVAVVLGWLLRFLRAEW